MSLSSFLHNKINFLEKNRDKKSIIQVSLFLSCFYILIQFIDSIFLFPKNIGDEWHFSRDLKFFIKNGYYLSVLNGTSIPYTLLSGLMYSFLEDVSLSLRMANASMVFFVILYFQFRKNLFVDNHKVIFMIHALIVLGTTGGIFYGTNDSFFYISFFILCSECYLWQKGFNVSNLFLVIIYTLCILSRPHFILYLPILFTANQILSTYKFGFKIKSILNPFTQNFIISLIFVLLFNYPKLMELNFSHNQGDYLPKFLFLSYADKSKTYKTDDPKFNWVQWCFYSQLVSDNEGSGLFAPFVEWNVVKEFKDNNPKVRLPNSYQEYIMNFPIHIIKRFPKSIIEVIVYSTRYLGIILLIIPFWLIQRKTLSSRVSPLFPVLLLFIGITIWAVIMPIHIAQQRLMPFYLMLLFLVTDNKSFMVNRAFRNLIFLNIILIDIIVLIALAKWGVFRSI